MISSISIINQKGDSLIYREYKDEVRRIDIESFITYLLNPKNAGLPPVVLHNGNSYFYISSKDLFIVACSKVNESPSMVFEFLYQLLELCKSYFKAELSDFVVWQNYVLIYELLDETMDFGVPQITEADVLKQFIVEGGLDSSVLSDLEKLSQLTMQATGANSWRPKAVTYKKNQIYIDLIEKISVQFNSEGEALRYDVQGEVQVKCELSGMPECTFGVNDKLIFQRDFNNQEEQQGVTFRDMSFHRCVKLNKFNAERAITFTPPDGEFVLMNYSITNNVQLPFKLISFYSKIENGLEIKIKLKSIFAQTITGQNVIVQIPVPSNSEKPVINSGVGKAKLEVEKNLVVWRIKKFQGQKEALLRVYVGTDVDVNESSWRNKPINIEFQIPMWTSSGVTVNFLRVVESSGYKTHKWIRYFTNSGDYSIRTK